MHLLILTIFPELFGPFLGTSLVGRAVEDELLRIEVEDLRDYTTDRHRSVDDEPYGGGGGMVMTAQPWLDAVRRGCERFDAPPRRILMSPQGRRLDESLVRELADHGNLVILCGRYEGIDERVLDTVVDDEISIGDFVLSGGELPAMVLAEAVSRQIPNVVGLEASVENDSFRRGLLDYPHYTRPREVEGLGVPEVLLSGNHAEIDRWRRGQALRATLTKRPDLLEGAELNEEDLRQLLPLAEELGVELPAGLQRRS
ncbi:MAG: tRNA (guanosine(37)-N1)-methyltransferase TrmD [Acidobacteriota bacterium]